VSAAMGIMRRRTRPAIYAKLPADVLERVRQMEQEAIASGTAPVVMRERGTGGQLTNRPHGTDQARIDPTGTQIWWFDDDAGSERGRWMISAFPSRTASAYVSRAPVRELPDSYSTG